MTKNPPEERIALALSKLTEREHALRKTYLAQPGRGMLPYDAELDFLLAVRAALVAE